MRCCDLGPVVIRRSCISEVSSGTDLFYRCCCDGHDCSALVVDAANRFYHNLMHMVWGARGEFPGGESDKTLLHRFRSFLLNIGNPWIDNRRFHYGKSLASWTNAIAYGRPRFSPRAGICLPGSRICIWARTPLSRRACMIHNYRSGIFGACGSGGTFYTAFADRSCPS